MSEHLGLLGILSEAAEIAKTMGVSAGEAYRIQAERAAERAAECERPSNVIQFRPRGA
jgi:hypothetical protein